ncbi:hypothetical protein [Bacteroides stercorirosoris]|uniref:hypothetical protein n=1 Tax=Bacteroides stercorirosoris TaxID=871324 RepID=UPI0009F8E51C|nr:hypothetical protein [Bacteroides stercorirosoris]
MDYYPSPSAWDNTPMRRQPPPQGTATTETEHNLHPCRRHGLWNKKTIREGRSTPGQTQPNYAVNQWEQIKGIMQDD